MVPHSCDNKAISAPSWAWAWAWAELGNIYSHLNNVSLCNNLTLGVALLLVLLVPLCGCLVSCWIVVDLETWLIAGRSQLSEDGARTLEYLYLLCYCI